MRKLKLTHWMIVKMDLATNKSKVYKTKLTKSQAKKILKELAEKHKTKHKTKVSYGVYTTQYYYGIAASNDKLDKLCA